MILHRRMPEGGPPTPFQIGIKPLPPAEWIDVDGQLPVYLDEKAALFTRRADDVFAAEPGTETAQTEVLAMLVEHLPARFADIYRRDGSVIEIVPAERRVALDADVPALRIAAGLVQEDLVLMRRGEAGWRIAAAALCFPSAWRLGDKFGRPIHEVHAPVPGFGAGTRPAELIARMFDHMRPEMPALRWNWSLFGDARLHHPESSHPDRPHFGDNAAGLVFRLERQTLRKLPASGDILFTIRIYVDPIAALATHPEGPAMAAAIAGQVETLSEEQAVYKGLALEREAVVARLRAIAG